MMSKEREEKLPGKWKIFFTRMLEIAKKTSYNVQNQRQYYFDKQVLADFREIRKGSEAKRSIIEYPMLMYGQKLRILNKLEKKGSRRLIRISYMKNQYKKGR